MRTSQLYPTALLPRWGVRWAGCRQGSPSGALVKAWPRGPSAGRGGDLRAGGAAGGPGFLTAGSDRAGEGTGALAANGLMGCGGAGTSVADPGATGLGTGGHRRPGSSGVRLGEGSCLWRRPGGCVCLQGGAGPQAGPVEGGVSQQGSGARPHTPAGGPRGGGRAVSGERLRAVHPVRLAVIGKDRE